MDDANEPTTDRDAEDTGFDADTFAREYDPEARARALQSLLIEKELLSSEAVDDIIARYEEDIGPLNGARVVARAWTDSAFRDRLLHECTAAMEAINIDIDTDTMDIEVVANDDDTHNLVVCTLCSCYPWTVLGLPPTWYKTPEYRSRAVRDPRGLLAEDFEVALADDVEMQVWDSTSELRYMVLPQRPPETENMDEEELVEVVTRDAMIGVDRLGSGQTAADGGVTPTTDEQLRDLDLGDRPTFEAPWQARAFAVAVALTDDRPWETFQHRLVEEVDRYEDADHADPESAYYEQWLRALERFIIEEELLDSATVKARTVEFDAGNRNAHEFVDGDPHGHVDGDNHGHDHNHAH